MSGELTAYEKFRARLQHSIELSRAARRCWLWHRFGEWRVTATGRVMCDGRITGTYAEQQRQCLRCKWIEVRSQTTSVESVTAPPRHP